MVIVQIAILFSIKNPLDRQQPLAGGRSRPDGQNGGEMEVCCMCQWPAEPASQRMKIINNGRPVQQARNTPIWCVSFCI